MSKAGLAGMLYAASAFARMANMLDTDLTRGGCSYHLMNWRRLRGKGKALERYGYYPYIKHHKGKKLAIFTDRTYEIDKNGAYHRTNLVRGPRA